MSLKLVNLKPSFLVRKNRNPTIDCKKQLKSCPCFKRWEKRQNVAYFFINNQQKHNPDASYQQFIKQSSNYNVIDFNDDFMHIIIFHTDREAPKIENNCSLLSCHSILINYREPNMLNDGMYFTNNTKREQNDAFNRQKIFIEDRHLQHEQIYHHNKSLTDIRSIITRYTYYDKLLSRYIHNRNNTDTDDNKNDEKQNNDELPLYETGELFNYSNKRSPSYVWCKFENLKAEWFGFPKFPVGGWDEKIQRAQYIAKSKFIKKDFVSSIDGNPMSAVRILTIYEYTANDALQREVCRVSRKTINSFNGSERQLKRAHGAFGHTYKLLMDTIEIFGQNMKDNAEYTILYRGMDNICKFNSATISCYTPTSTTTSRAVAASFAEGTGCILELHQHAVFDGCYLSLKKFSKFPLEEEWLFYGKHSHLYVMYIQHPIMDSNSYYFGSIALIEDLMCDSNDSPITLRRKTREKKGKKDGKNRKKSRAKSMTKLMSKPTKQRINAIQKFDIYSKESIENLIKLIQKYIEYDALKNRKYSASKSPSIGTKDSAETNEIQMIQFHHIICKKKRIYFRNKILIECINKAFGFKDDIVRISNIVDIFPNVGEIVFKYKVDQSSIIDYCLHDTLDSNDKCGLYKITVNYKLQNGFRRLSDKFNNNMEWEIFRKKNKVIWQKSIQVTDSDYD